MRQTLAQPDFILASVFERGIGTGPGTVEDRALAQCSKAVRGTTQQQNIELFKLGITAARQGVVYTA